MLFCTCLSRQKYIISVIRITMNRLLFVGYLMHVDVLMYNDVLLVFKSFILKKLKIVQFQQMFSECYII